MKTIVLRVNPQEPEEEKISVAAEFIREGGLVAFPTETVYGLGANALDPKAVLAVFEAKKRPLDNPPIVHIADVKEIFRLTKGVPSEAKRLMKRFWPGPLTLIFERSAIVPDITVAGLDTIAIRMPRHNVALALISQSGCPIAAPSANLAGKPSPTSAKHVLDDLDGRINAVLDAGPTHIGVESTVLDLTVDPPQILRPGGTTFEELKKVVRRARLSPLVVADKALPVEQARSPGLKHKHYAPNADLILVEGELASVVDKVKELVRLYGNEGKKVGVLATDETIRNYGANVVKSMGSRNDLAGVARNLFSLLREFDSENVDIIIAENVQTTGLGLAIVNRLRRAANYKIIKT